MSLADSHPSKSVQRFLNRLECRFSQLRVSSLSFFTGIIRKRQEQQEAVSAELIREAREAQTLFEHIISDGVITPAEREQLLRLLREMEVELETGRVI